MPVRYSKHSAGPMTRHSGSYLPDYTSWTKDSLVMELERRKLPKSGTKKELIARLLADDGT